MEIANKFGMQLDYGFSPYDCICMQVVICFCLANNVRRSECLPVEAMLRVDDCVVLRRVSMGGGEENPEPPIPTQTLNRRASRSECLLIKKKKNYNVGFLL